MMKFIYFLKLERMNHQCESQCLWKWNLIEKKRSCLGVGCTTTIRLTILKPNCQKPHVKISTLANLIES